VEKINDHGKEIRFLKSGEERGEITQKLYDALTDIQTGKIAAPEGWLRVKK